MSKQKTFKETWDEESITKEMKTWFETRTNKHIALVQKYSKKIEDSLPEFKGIIKQTENHDDSKFKEPEKTPYVYISWMYKMKDSGKDYKIPSDINDTSATEHHIKNNSHHPEFHTNEVIAIDRENRDKSKTIIDASKMPDLDIAEMVADWCAMSEEKGSSPKDWADKTVNKRWKFSDKQKEMIYKIIEKIWQQ